MSMQKTRDINSHLISNSKTVIIDHDNNYYCYRTKLKQDDLKDFIFEIADNTYTIFDDIEIVELNNNTYTYNYKLNKKGAVTNE